MTMDRLKVLEVEADYKAWKEYARQKGLHPAILNFLELKKEYFYKIETTVNGRSYVTARGWEDLSEILSLYEEEGMKTDENLVAQYIRNDRVVREFTAYYDLFNKYKKEYQTEEILDGTAKAQTLERARIAAFDERLSLLGMLTDKVISEIREDMERSDYLVELLKNLKAVKAALEKAGKEGGADPGREQVPVAKMLDYQIQGRMKQMESARMAGSLSERDRRRCRRLVRFLEEGKKKILLEGTAGEKEAFGLLKEAFDSQTMGLKEQTKRTKERLENLFRFVEEAFAEGNEMLILVTELTVNNDSARFIGQFGCPAYQRHNQELMLSERQNSLQEEIAALDLDGVS